MPKTLFQLEPAHEAVVLELGTNNPGEIERLATIAAPEIGIITQIGYSHLEGLKNLEGVKAEKLSIMKGLERGNILILNGNDPLLADVKSGVHRLMRVGFEREGNDPASDQIWSHEKGTSFYIKRFLDETISERMLFETLLIGRHNVVQCLMTILICRLMRMDFEMIQKALASFKAVPGRLALKKIAGINFIDDTYNSNPTSFKAALDTLKEFKVREKKGVVCGDMLELGEQSELMHRQMGAHIADLLFDFVIAVGPQSAHLADEALKRGFDPPRMHRAKDSAEAGKLCRQLAQAGDYVLVKGSRAMHMERIFDCFTTSSIH